MLAILQIDVPARDLSTEDLARIAAATSRIIVVIAGPLPVKELAAELRRGLPGRDVIGVVVGEDPSSTDRRLITEILDEGNIPVVIAANQSAVVRVAAQLSTVFHDYSILRAGKRRSRSDLTRLVVQAVAAAMALVALTVAVFAFSPWRRPSTTFTVSRTSVTLGQRPVAVFVQHANLPPGFDIVQPITVTNGTDHAIRYSVSADATEAEGLHLKEHLAVELKSVDRTTRERPCDQFDGDLLYAGDLSADDGMMLTSASRDRGGDLLELAARSRQTMCFRLRLPTSVHSGIREATTIAFIFRGE